MGQLYAQIIVDRGVNDIYTYSVPETMMDKIKIGSLVEVSFGYGKKAPSRGVVAALTNEVDTSFHIKPIQSILYPTPILTEKQIKFWQFLKDYYLATWSDIFYFSLLHDIDITDFNPVQEEIITQVEPTFRCKNKQQRQLMTNFHELSKKGAVTKIELLSIASSSKSSLQTFIKNGTLAIEYQAIDTIIEYKSNNKLAQLTPTQEAALNEIFSKFSATTTTLLHGVSSSGKSEIYKHLIDKTISQGGQVLMIMPDNRLSSQVAKSMQEQFASTLLTWDSSLSERKRALAYQQQLSDTPYQFVLGIKSALSLPYKNLRLIIIDQEHDANYKANDRLKLHARDAAVYLAFLHKANIVLGSATPSLQSWANTLSKKYSLVELSTPYKAVNKPIITTVNISQVRQANQTKGVFSYELIKAINKCLENKKQVLLYHNKGGFTSGIECKSCGYIAKCPNCDLPLVAYRNTTTLKCHCCGYKIEIPLNCPSCGSNRIIGHGNGTEKIELQAAKLFPQAVIERLDYESAHSTAAYNKILKRFETKETDILIGNHIIAEGINFANVGLIGVINADSLFMRADFRANEYAYQTISQLIGCVGRDGNSGEVIIQTYQPNNLIFDDIINNDLHTFYQRELEERRIFNYPPFTRLIRLTVSNSTEQNCEMSAQNLTNALKKRFGNRVLGPDKPAISKIDDKYIRTIIVKIENSANLNKAKAILMEEINLFSRSKFSTQINIDVDPIKFQ